MEVLKKTRMNTDVTMSVSIVDNGVAIHTDNLTEVYAGIYSERQRAMVGRCEYTPDGDKIILKSPAANQRFEGPCRLILACTMDQRKATYDAMAFEVVRWSADVLPPQDLEEASEPIGIHIEFSEISSSLVHEVLAAAIAATDAANTAAGNAEDSAQAASAAAIEAGVQAPLAEQGAARANEAAASAEQSSVKANDAADRAETATGNAERATSAATSAAASANNAAARAENAADRAESAADAANSAAVSANAAKDAATAAAGKANEASVSANNAAKRANEAADRAETAADNAEQAASAATTASAGANNAASRAEGAAGRAEAGAVAANTAASSANEAKDAATAATGRAETAATAANEAAARANEAAEVIESVKTDVESQGQLIEDLQNTKIDRENDDYYPKMAVGLADNLAGEDVVDSVISFRRSGGGAINDGNARMESIKGNSLVWNQLMLSNNLLLKKSSGFFQIVAYDTTKKNHVYCVEMEDIDSVGDELRFIGMSSSGSYIETTHSYGGGYVSAIFTMSPYQGTIYVRAFARGAAGDSATFNNVRFYDLTQMFGAGNEPATIDEFYKRIPMGVDINAYNEGEVIHMDVQNLESVGVNQWDEEWEEGGLTEVGTPTTSNNQIRSKNYTRVLPNKEYYSGIVGKSEQSWMQVALYDKNHNFIKRVWSNNKTFITPDNAHYIKMSTNAGTYIYGNVYKNDICITLSDSSINGKYFPYVKRVQDLGIIRKYFPDGMKSVNDVHDEIRYNKTTQKWEKVKRIGEVDMGTLIWEYLTYEGVRYFRSSSFIYGSLLANALSSKYTHSNQNNVLAMTDKSFIVTQAGTFVIDSSYTSAATFKAAIAGVMLYYELEEPIITELDAEDQFRNLDYQVWNAGTEKAIADGKSAPLAAEIAYGFNAVGKIKELENLVTALRAKVGI